MRIRHAVFVALLLTTVGCGSFFRGFIGLGPKEGATPQEVQEHEAGDQAAEQAGEATRGLVDAAADNSGVPGLGFLLDLLIAAVGSVVTENKRRSA